MAGRKSAKNEIQDPSLPSKKRARWRLIGAAVLATLAVIILPFALESEPRKELGDVAVKMPPRTELGKMERVLPTGNTVPDSTRVAADSVGKPLLPADRVKPVVIDSQGDGISKVASVSTAALPPVKPLAPVKPATAVNPRPNQRRPQKKSLRLQSQRSKRRPFQSGVQIPIALSRLHPVAMSYKSARFQQRKVHALRWRVARSWGLSPIPKK